MKLYNTKSIILALVATTFTFVSVQTHARSVKPRKGKEVRRVVNMAYNMADRIELEASALSSDELATIKSNLRQIRKVLNGEIIGGNPYGASAYSSTCTAIERTSYGANISHTLGVRSGTLGDIIKDCKYLATSQYGQNAGMKLSALTLTDVAGSTDSATCVIINRTSYGANISTKMGTIASGSLQGLDEDCDSLAKAMFGSRGDSKLSYIKSL